MDSKLLVGLIKEVVKSEVRQQVKEELAKLIKSGAVTLNSQRKTTTPTLREMTEVASTQVKRQQPAPIQQQRPQIKKEFTKDPMINEILNMTQPFSAEQRKEGAQSVGSVLDMIQPNRDMDGDWETMDFRETSVPQSVPQFESTGDGLQDATVKALTRDYSELVKRFK
jgi:hypothetical protein